MRLWSLHPQYLDRQGLLALWREGLLAQKVLTGKTKGYKHHPQLIRFRETEDPPASIGAYLHQIVQEAERRSYNFDATKILSLRRVKIQIPVFTGQLKFEHQHLLRKLKVRDPFLYNELSKKKNLQTHPIFYRVRGKVHVWERV